MFELVWSLYDNTIKVDTYTDIPDIIKSEIEKMNEVSMHPKLEQKITIYTMNSDSESEPHGSKIYYIHSILYCQYTDCSEFKEFKLKQTFF